MPTPEAHRSRLERRAGHGVLEDVRTAIGKRNGKLILLDAVVQPGNHPDFAKIIDLEMLLLPGGASARPGDFETLCAGAGFALSGITPTASPVCVIRSEGRLAVSQRGGTMPCLNVPVAC